MRRCIPLVWIVVSMVLMAVASDNPRVRIYLGLNIASLASTMAVLGAAIWLGLRWRPRNFTSNLDQPNPLPRAPSLSETRQ